VITSALVLANGDRIGLAMVRRQALEAGQLRVGSAETGALLTVTRPEVFNAPPVGTGSIAP
jgi:hypothetical protein